VTETATQVWEWDQEHQCWLEPVLHLAVTPGALEEMIPGEGTALHPLSAENGIPTWLGRKWHDEIYGSPQRRMRREAFDTWYEAREVLRDTGQDHDRDRPGGGTGDRPGGTGSLDRAGQGEALLGNRGLPRSAASSGEASTIAEEVAGSDGARGDAPKGEGLR
jgi:hypothetical protein